MFTFDPNAVTYSMSEGVAIPCVTDDTASCDIDACSGRVFSEVVTRLHLSIEDNVPHLSLSAKNSGKRTTQDFVYLQFLL